MQNLHDSFNNQYACLCACPSGHLLMNTLFCWPYHDFTLFIINLKAEADVREAQAESAPMLPLEPI